MRESNGAKTRTEDLDVSKSIWFQCFMTWRLTMEAIFLLRQLMENYQAKWKTLHIVLINLERAYDRVPRYLIWWVLNKMNVSRYYIEVIKDIYERAVRGGPKISSWWGAKLK